MHFNIIWSPRESSRSTEQKEVEKDESESEKEVAAATNAVARSH